MQTLSPPLNNTRPLPRCHNPSSTRGVNTNPASIPVQKLWSSGDPPIEMDESSNINATELQSSLSAAQQRGVQDNQQPIEVYDLTTETPLRPTMDRTMDFQQRHVVPHVLADHKMDDSTNIAATALQSSLSAAEQHSVHNEQPIEVYDLTTETPLLPTVDDTMNDQQPRLVYHVQADHDSENEEVHVKQLPDKTVDFFAGIQDSEVNWVSKANGSEGKMHQTDTRDKSTMECGNSLNIGSNHQDGKATEANSNLQPANTAEEPGETLHDPQDLATIAMNLSLYDDAHNEGSGIFVDFEERPDVSEDEESSVTESNSDSDEEIGFDAVSYKASADCHNNQILNQHLSIPDQRHFASLDDLLSSHNAPGRGLFKIESVLNSEENKVDELEEWMEKIQAKLEGAKERREKAENIIQKASDAFSRACGEAGISNDLWEEYEAFCESLEPKFGNRGGWSVTCFENHNGSYVQWDPDLDLFMESSDMPLGSCNFRCEATTVEHEGIPEYVVEFWPLAKPEPRSETAKTWKQQYVSSHLCRSYLALCLSTDQPL